MWNFRKVRAWERSVELSRVLYDVTCGFPDRERYGLTNQLRRAVVSISSNIAEGCGRRTSKDFISFMYNAIGSVKEVESELFVAEKLGFVGMEKVEELIEELEEIGKMLSGMIEKEKNRNVK